MKFAMKWWGAIRRGGWEKARLNLCSFSGGLSFRNKDASLHLDRRHDIRYERVISYIVNSTPSGLTRCLYTREML